MTRCPQCSGATTYVGLVSVSCVTAGCANHDGITRLAPSFDAADLEQRVREAMAGLTIDPMTGWPYGMCP